MSAHRRTWIGSFSLALFFSLPGLASGTAPVLRIAERAAQVQSPARTETPVAPGSLFSSEQIAGLLPATVYFQGKTAPLQLRNAAGTSFGKDAIVWASLVDSSGYSSSVQERYQFYLVSEAPLRFGDVRLPAGAYGGGFLGDRFVIMDLGGHTLGEGPVETDAKLSRPRPLQMAVDPASGASSSVRLYLGRHWILLQPDRSETNVR
jgi:hypothetical protein